MPELVRVWPKPGLLIPDPLNGDFFSPEGRDTDCDTYVQRRLAEGALLLSEPEPEEASEPSEPAEEEPLPAPPTEPTPTEPAPPTEPDTLPEPAPIETPPKGKPGKTPPDHP